MRIIAIDPGYERMGVAIMEKSGRTESLLFSECFKTSPTLSHELRLRSIGQRIESLLQEYQPELMAIETLFFTNNQKTALHVSESRGVMLYVASCFGIPVSEFAPMAIKIAVTGYGLSDKSQVTDMVKKLIRIDKPIRYDDEYDAIAIGLTCFAINKKTTDR